MSAAAEAVRPQPLVVGWDAVDPDRARERLRTRLVVGAALLLALGLRLPYVTLPLGIDEGGLSLVAHQWGTGHGSLYGAYWLDRPPFLVALFNVAERGGATGVRVLGAVAALALVACAAGLARAAAGHRAARVAAVLAAVFTGSFALRAVFTPAELLAAVPAAVSVGALVAAHRRDDARWLVLAGAAAVTAVLIKQSFLDAGAAGAAYLIAAGVRRPRGLARNVPAYAAGALVPLAALGVLLAAAHMSVGDLVYALFGFRLDALHTLSATLSQRVSRLGAPAVGSGLVLALAMVPAGLFRLRRDPVLAVTLGVWTLAAAVGVLGGGSYWPHYLIQLVAPTAVLTGVALARLRPPVRRMLVVAVAAFAVLGTVASAVVIRDGFRERGELAIARYIRAHARPGDTQYVLYSRANLAYFTGLESPYPYAWTLMDRAIPGATLRLDRLLASPRRPTWIVVWQRVGTWGLDRDGVTKRLLHERYRRVARIHHRGVWLRRDEVRA